jgi:TrmH family RNA methyltransferase
MMTTSPRNAITSRHNPIVARFRAARDGDAPETLLLDGAHLVAEALRSRVRLREAVVSSKAAARTEIAALIRQLAAHGVKAIAASDAVMDAVSPVRSPSPIVAIAERPASDPARVYAGADALVLIAADVQDPGNLGAIVRVAEAAGAAALIAAGACADPFGWKALRGSMGSVLRLPVIVRDDLGRATAEAGARGCRIVATVPRGGRSLFAVDLRGRVAILVGGEGPGLTPAAMAAADERVTIPMESPVESLNAAVTAALVMYEARRQRTHGPAVS